MPWIDNSRIAAIFAVVLLHVSANVLSVNPVGSDNWWVGAFFNSVTRWGVPVFAMLSGALLLGAGKREDSAAFYRKRAARILLPLLFWSVFYLLWQAFRTVLKNAPVDWAAMGWSLVLGQPYYHLWFLYMLVGFYLLVPFLRMIFEQATDPQLLQLSVILFAIVCLQAIFRAGTPGDDRQPFLVWFIDYLPYFTFGGFIARQQGALPGRPLMVGVAGMALLLLFVVSAWASRAGLPAVARYCHDNLGVITVAASLSILMLCTGWKRPLAGKSTARIGTLVFGVYLLHPLVLEVLRLTRYPQAVLPVAGYAAYLLLIGLLVFGVSLLIAWGISRVPYLRRII
jgi:surface polysaccharide O-acyltransferase-like enzyme